MQRKSKRKGAVTLLATSVLVTAALIMSLASYKVLFYQIKRAQNEIKARQAHWLAEGGIECGYAYIQLNPEQLNPLASTEKLPLDLLCAAPLGLESVFIEPLGSQRYLIHAVGRFSHIQRSVTQYQPAGVEGDLSVPVSESLSTSRQLVWDEGGWYAK